MDLCIVTMVLYPWTRTWKGQASPAAVRAAYATGIIITGQSWELVAGSGDVGQHHQRSVRGQGGMEVAALTMSA
jgi:hypothetical protein